MASRAKKRRKIKKKGSNAAATGDNSQSLLATLDDKTDFQDVLESTLNRGEEAAYLPNGRIRFHEATEESTGKIMPGSVIDSSTNSNGKGAADDQVIRTRLRQLYEHLGLPDSKDFLCHVPSLQNYPAHAKSTSTVGCGLVNLGNTCFMNALLQCLCYAPRLSSYFVNHGHSKDKNGHACPISGCCVVCTLEKLFRQMQNRRMGAKPANPKKVHSLTRCYC